jgi:hypothetical protein
LRLQLFDLRQKFPDLGITGQSAACTVSRCRKSARNDGVPGRIEQGSAPGERYRESRAETVTCAGGVDGIHPRWGYQTMLADLPSAMTARNDKGATSTKRHDHICLTHPVGERAELVYRQHIVARLSVRAAGEG